MCEGPRATNQAQLVITLQIAESVEMDPGGGFNSTPFPGVGEFSLTGSW